MTLFLQKDLRIILKNQRNNGSFGWKLSKYYFLTNLYMYIIYTYNF